MKNNNILVNSLYFKLIGAIAVILFVSSLSGYYLISTTTRDKILETEKTITTIFSSALGKSMLEQLLFSDPAVFQGLVSSLVDGEHVYFAYIIDENGEVIVHTFSPVIPDDIVFTTNYTQKHHTLHTEEYGSIIVSSQPLFYGMKGYLVLGLSKPDMTDLWYKIGAIMLISSILLIVVISFILKRSITDPLRRINRSISNTDTDGIPANEIPDTPTKEINRLSRSMNTMITAITSSREALKRSEAQFRGMIESTSDHIWEVDILGTYTYSSPQILKLSGYRSEEVVGRKSFELMDSKSAEINRTLLSKLVEQRISFNAIETTIIKKDGTFAIFESSGVPFYENNELVGFRGIDRDITIRKKSEELILKTNEELKIHKEHLEELVKDRTSELEESLSQLKRTQGQLVESEKMASLGGLVAGVAHEINTPVGIGVTAASHMRKRATLFKEKYSEGKLSRKDFESFIQGAVEETSIMLTNMERAAHLIQSFKQVAVDQTSEDIRELEMGEYLQELLASLHPKLKKTKHIIKLEIPNKVYVKTIAGAISQIFTNLIMNSLLHGFDGIEEGVVTIAVKSDSGLVHIEYRDSGKGIPPNNIPKVFEPFFTTKRGKGGTGLGMHILYNLITQKLFGTVECHDTQSEGVFFEISFPHELS